MQVWQRIGVVARDGALAVRLMMGSPVKITSPEVIALDYVRDNTRVEL